MKDVISRILKDALNKLNVKIKEDEIYKFIEIPPSVEIGDYAFPCFSLSKKIGEGPHQIALMIREKIAGNFPEEQFDDIQTLGPYVNFFVNRKSFAINLLQEILSKKEKFGKPYLNEKSKSMVEFSQPNTHKAFHVGHIRGTSLGESISRILEFSGDKVIRANYSGDTGMHVAKWIWCYMKYHLKEKLSDDESWIASIYVDAVRRLKENEKLQEEANEINRMLEYKENGKLTKLWEKSRKLSINSWEKIYKELNAKFDVYFFESEMEKRAKELSSKLRERKIATKSDGAIIVNLKKYNLGVWVLLRKDGTVLYSAKDIALAEKKFSKYKIDKNINVIGAAQSLHIAQLFKTLELMKFANTNGNIFVPYAEVRLPSGKMSSRTGENVLYSKFMEEIMEYAKSEIKKREPKIQKKELEKRALRISIASIKYSMLKQSPNKNIIFDKKEALNFEGDSGAYLLYSYARASSVLRKASSNKPKNIDSYDSDELEPPEFALVKKLSQFPEIAFSSYRNLNPSLIANYSYQLSQIFSEFYHSCPIINSKQNGFRLSLTEAFRQTLGTCLNLLGIEILEKM